MRVTSLILLLSSILRADWTGNLLPDPGMESTAHWRPLTIGAPCVFTADKEVRHSRAQSLRIDAKETARSYWQSDPIPVAPGEQIRAGAWVKVRDVPSGKGTVIVIGEFTDSHGRNLQVQKFDVADVKNTEWQHVSGRQKVPAGATQLRLRLGMSYSLGTCWFDDAHVQAGQPIIARMDVDDARLSPAIEAIPVTIVNRTGARGTARIDVALGKDANSKELSLDGSPVQRVDVPFKVAGRGKRELTARLFVNGASEPASTDARSVTIPPPMIFHPAIPTHWAVEDGAPTIEGEVELALPKSMSDGASLVVRLEDSKGAVLGTAAPITSDKLVDGWNHYTLSSPALPEGLYKLIAELTPRSGELIRAEQPWSVIPRRLARVTLNADGYPVYDGKAIFPMGIFNGGLHVKEMGASGFTINHAYNAANAELGEKPDDIGLKRFLDASEENGLKVCLLIPRGIVFGGDWDGFRRRVRMFRNHPAILCWDEEEGIARGDMPPAYLPKIRQIIREEDPNHPLMVGDSRDIIGRITDRSNFFPVDQMDLGMWWWYPLPLRTDAKAGDALQGEEATNLPELVPPAFLVKRNTDKPIWVAVQAYKKKAESRYPTPAEYRAQAYIAVIHGAKGLMWYGGSVTGGLYLGLNDGHWPELLKLARELRELAPVFMSPNGDAPNVSPSDSPISVCLKRAVGRDVILAANRGLQPIDVTLTFTKPKSRTAKVLSEDRTVEIREGVIHDRFEPLAVHVYELSAAK